MWSPSAEAAIKAGASCAKVGITKVSGGKKFTCKRSGKKLIWGPGVLVQSNTATEVPAPLPASTPSPTPTAKPISDQLSFKDSMIYRIVDGQLERKSQDGVFFSTDSRLVSAINPVRAKAYSEINQASRSLSHPNIELVWTIRDSFPKEMIDYTKLQIENSAALWNDVFPTKVKVFVTLVTEQDKDYLTNTKPMFSDMVRSVSRFDSRNERPFVTGGGGWILNNGEQFGLIVLGTASYMTTNYMNYEWPEVAAHEFVHVVQQYFMRSTSRQFNSEGEYTKIMPLHLSEGSANTIGFLTGFRNLGWSSDAMDWMVWQRARDNLRWNKITNLSQALEVIRGTEERSPNEAFEMSYAIGGLINEYLISKYGFNAFINLLKATQTESSYDAALMKSIKKSKDEFYQEVAPYVLETILRLSPY